MRRREFITLIGAAAALPFAASAQQPAMPVIGFLSALSNNSIVDQITKFHRGLNEMGFVEGQNVSIEYRWAEGQYERLPAMAAELVRRPVSVIVAQAPPAALAAKAATATIPIVFVVGFDPIAAGLVESSQPTGWQCHQYDIDHRTARAKADRSAARAHSQGCCGRHAR